MQDNKIGRTAASSLKQIALASVGFGALIVGAMPATAQDQESEATTRTLEAVTVTATKREETLQDVPVAVSVVDESVIERAEVQDISDLQSLVPSLRVGQLQNSANTSFFIRGFGNGANNAGIEPSVGVFVDGVYRSRSAAGIVDLPNLQRVEVLRGPQSTLFGKNASAGVISIVTREPQFEQSGSASLTLGNYNTVRIGGDITGPISDTVAYSLSGSYNVRDGYAESLATGGDLNNRDRFDLRGQLLIVPSDELKVRLIADYGEISEICCSAGNLVNGATGAAVFALGGALDPEDPFSYDSYLNFEPENEVENAGVSAQVDYDFDFATLTSITSYRTSDYGFTQDVDFTSLDIAGDNTQDNSLETFTQEFRLTSNSDGQFDWMIGGFYFDETVEIVDSLLFGTEARAYFDAITASEALGGSAISFLENILSVDAGTFIASGTGLTSEYGQDNQSYSLFGQLDYHVTDRLTATLGLNYTSDEKDAYGRGTSTEPFSALNLTAIGAGLIEQQALAAALLDLGVNAADPAQLGGFVMSNPEVFAQIQAGAAAFAAANAANADVNPLLALRAIQITPPFQAFPNTVETGSSSDSNTDYTIRFAYDVTDNFNAYISYATGFKATSWNLSRDSRPTAASAAALTGAGSAVPNLSSGSRFAPPEESEVYEIGLKGQFETVAVNLAIFDQSIENFQSNVFTGTGFALASAGTQSVQGLEIDATWQATEALTLSGSLTVLDPEFESFEQSARGDISGTTPSSIPPEAASVAANYAFQIGDLDAYISGDWVYESGSDLFNATEADAGFIDLQALVGEQREVSTFNASAGIESDNGWGLSVWGRNIFDDEYITTAFTTPAQPGSINGYQNVPATYGVTARKRF